MYVRMQICQMIYINQQTNPPTNPNRKRLNRSRNRNQASCLSSAQISQCCRTSHPTRRIRRRQRWVSGVICNDMHSGSSLFSFIKGDGGRRFFEGDQGGSSSRDRLPRVEEVCCCWCGLWCWSWLGLVEWRELGDEILMVM